MPEFLVVSVHLSNLLKQCLQYVHIFSVCRSNKHLQTGTFFSFLYSLRKHHAKVEFSSLKIVITHINVNIW